MQDYPKPSWQRRVAAMLLTALPLAGCYNTYTVPSNEFRKLQSPAAVRLDSRLAENLKEEEAKALLSRRADDPVTVTSDKNKQVAVNRATRLYVRSQGGRRYQVTPFNFSMYSSQLVASDRDTLVPLANLKSYEVDLLSTGKTAGVIAAGVALAAGFIAVIVVTSGRKTFN
ncbi:MAG: hypothetical protein RIT45_4170 [Pseudomonadota bacterium]|jgi:hypothetical protein